MYNSCALTNEQLYNLCIFTVRNDSSMRSPQKEHHARGLPPHRSMCTQYTCLHTCLSAALVLATRLFTGDQLELIIRPCAGAIAAAVVHLRLPGRLAGSTQLCTRKQALLYPERSVQVVWPLVRECTHTNERQPWAHKQQCWHTTTSTMQCTHTYRHSCIGGQGSSVSNSYAWESATGQRKNEALQSKLLHLPAKPTSAHVHHMNQLTADAFMDQLPSPTTAPPSHCMCAAHLRQQRTTPNKTACSRQHHLLSPAGLKQLHLQQNHTQHGNAFPHARSWLSSRTCTWSALLQ
ncbi:hypothetical protein COO60DRAFT_532435 [Scenedesmus sp. NREL 46B-D3]|nr:hypothetical protein COO60DRAFT_532435 [Scenedesmus sp. NREL 46B-D3]